MLLEMPLSDRAIRRRSKNYLRERTLELFVPTLPGFEVITVRELRELGLSAHALVGGAEFPGDLASIYRANIGLRSGNRVLLRLGEFLSQTYPMLYDRARKIPWEVVLGKCLDVSIDVSSRRSRLRHMEHIRSVIFDSISARTHPLGLDPRLVANGALTIKARLQRDRCSLSLDTTGAHLHFRGYRLASSAAPIRETTAAGILLAADAKKYDVVVDPFCGSGTFAIEADMIARNVPPGAARPFAIENSGLHSPGIYRHQQQQLHKGIRPSTQRIYAFDISDSAAATASSNASRAGTAGVIVGCADALSLQFGDLKRPSERGLIVTNVPYGQRLGSISEALTLLNGFLAHVARTAPGWHVAIVSPTEVPVSHIAINQPRRLPFSNGGLPVVATLGQVVVPDKLTGRTS